MYSNVLESPESTILSTEQVEQHLQFGLTKVASYYVIGSDINLYQLTESIKRSDLVGLYFPAYEVRLADNNDLDPCNSDYVEGSFFVAFYTYDPLNYPSADQLTAEIQQYIASIGGPILLFKPLRNIARNIPAEEWKFVTV